MISGKGNDELLFLDPHFKYQNNWAEERSSLPTAVSRPASLAALGSWDSFYHHGRIHIAGKTRIILGKGLGGCWCLLGTGKCRLPHATGHLYAPSSEVPITCWAWCRQQGSVLCVKSKSQHHSAIGWAQLGQTANLQFCPLLETLQAKPMAWRARCVQLLWPFSGWLCTPYH